MKKILIIGGSKKSYMDLFLIVSDSKLAGMQDIHLYTYAKHLEVAKHKNITLHNFKSHTGSLGLYDVKIIYDLAADIDIIMIGSELGNDFDCKKAILAILNINKPLIIDGDALMPEILKIYDRQKHKWILTPNHSQFKRLFHMEVAEILKITQQYQLTIILKEIEKYVDINEMEVRVPIIDINKAHEQLIDIIANHIL